MNLFKLVVTGLSLALLHPLKADTLRVGIIGCDTGHATAFTKLFNDPSESNYIPGFKVVAAYRGGSPDIPESMGRLDGIVKTLTEKYSVKMTSTVEELCGMVDAVLLESLDGRPHLEQIRPVIKAGKPVFIDKPVAGSLKDVLAITKLAKESGVPWFSSSAYRFYPCMLEVKTNKIGDIRSAISYGPCETEEHHPDFYWYGIHPSEALFTIMGQGCETVSRSTTSNTDVATGIWKDGRVGIFIGQRNASTHKVILFGSKGVAEQKGDGDYAPLVRQIATFFQTKVAPVPNEETLQIYAFMEAADESKRQGGKPVSLSDVILKNSPKP